MATNTFQPDVPEIGLGGASFIRQGVSDTSGVGIASAVGQIGQAAVDATIGREMAGVSSDTEREVSGYLARAESEDIDAPIVSQEISPKEREVLAQATKYYGSLDSAATQGAINDDQLKARVESATAKYIARFPGLAQEFRQKAAMTLGQYDANIKYIEGIRQQRASSSADTQKKWLDSVHTRAQQAKIPGYSDVYLGGERLAHILGVLEELEPMRALAEQYSVMKQSIEDQATISGEQTRFAAPAYIADNIMNAENHVTSAVLSPMGIGSVEELATKSLSTADAAAVVSNVKTWAAAQKAEYSGRFIHSDPNMSTSYFTYVDEYAKMVEGFATGAWTKEQMENKVGVFKNTAALALAGESTPTLGFTVGLLQLVPPNAFSDGPTARIFQETTGRHLTKELGVLREKTFPAGGSLYSGAHDKATVEGVIDKADALGRALEETGSPESLRKEMDVLKGVLNGMGDAAVRESIPQSTYLKVFTTIAHPDWTKLVEVDEAFAGELLDLSASSIDGYIEKAARDMTSKMTANPEIAKQIILTTDASGRLLFVPQNNKKSSAEMAKVWNTTYHLGVLGKAYQNTYNKPQVEMLRTLSEGGRLPPNLQFMIREDR